MSYEGPVVVLVNVEEAFLAYKSGILNQKCRRDCSDLNHAVVVVGELKNFNASWRFSILF